MNNLKKIILLLLPAAISVSVNAQVLITLLLDDALNTDKIEFGLSGGIVNTVSLSHAHSL